MKSMSPTLPPTPPPLPIGTNSQRLPTITTILEKETTEQKSNPCDSYEISSKTCSLYWNYLTESLEDFALISLYNNVETVIQKGPKYVSHGCQHS